MGIKPIKVLIATPCYQGVCHADYTLSLLKTFAFFQSRPDVSILHQFILNDCLVPRARNYLCALALSDESITHILFIDSDISWQPDDILKLIKHDKPIIGAAVAKKQYHWERLRSEFVKEVIDDKSLTPEQFQKKIKSILVDYAVNKNGVEKQQNGLLEVKHVGTSLLLIKREVLETLKEKYPEQKVQRTTLNLPEKAKQNYHCFFELRVNDGKYLTEDYSFCQRWVDLGEKLYVDLTINTLHFGMETFQSDALALQRRSHS